MKIAGRKNDGAWFRANKVIQDLTNDERLALQDKLNDKPETDAFYNAIVAIAEAAGYPVPGNDKMPQDYLEMVTQYTTEGIPRQAWYGRLSYDTYLRSGAPGAYEYAPEHQTAAHQFGKMIRKVMRDFTFARRAALDLGNKAAQSAGNPSGVANATQEIEPG